MTFFVWFIYYFNSFFYSSIYSIYLFFVPFFHLILFQILVAKALLLSLYYQMIFNILEYDVVEGSVVGICFPSAFWKWSLIFCSWNILVPNMWSSLFSLLGKHYTFSDVVSWSSFAYFSYFFLWFGLWYFLCRWVLRRLCYLRIFSDFLRE